ncbi:hypothetical protein D9758_011183 [Tetrapyrgos nigripes]|uniref:Uncharacterized protein n=1 Tax=Tetrapyrgos nigripes TaxID=182062 RepID=A0A8H5D6K1_9AGAR|nr:hypothetical protein D9758_011183 [Tetrapyrgos nigripes]
MDSTATSQDSTEELQWCTGCSMRKPLSLFQKKGASTAKTCAGCRGRPSQVKKKPKITSNSTVDDDNDLADSLLDLPLVSFSDFIRTIESVQGIHSFAAQVSLKEEQLGSTFRAKALPPSPENNVPADVELTSDAFSGRSSSPIDYDGSDNEQELEKYVRSAEDMIQNLRRAADLIEAQLPYRNFPWLKALNDGKLGKEAHHFVADIAGFEDSRGVRPTTWASSSSKAAKRVERNTLGYQVQRKNE